MPIGNVNVFGIGEIGITGSWHAIRNPSFIIFNPNQNAMQMAPAPPLVFLMGSPAAGKILPVLVRSEPATHSTVTGQRNLWITKQGWATLTMSGSSSKSFADVGVSQFTPIHTSSHQISPHDGRVQGLLRPPHYMVQRREANLEFDACNCDIRCVHLRYAVH